MLCLVKASVAMDSYECCPHGPELLGYLSHEVLCFPARSAQSAICYFSDAQIKAKRDYYYIQSLGAALTLTSILGTLAAEKGVAQVSTEAGFHGTMRESVDFILEVLVMRGPSTPASIQD